MKGTREIKYSDRKLEIKKVRTIKTKEEVRKAMVDSASSAEFVTNGLAAEFAKLRVASNSDQKTQKAVTTFSFNFEVEGS